MEVIQGFVKVVDRISKWSGEWIAWLVLINSFAVAYDVVNRYVFGKATDWGYDVGWMLYSVSFMIGAAYTLQQKGHVRVDLIWQRFSPRAQAALDFVYWIVFILPICILMTIYGVEYAVKSWQIWERSAYSAWRPYIYPFKTIIPISFTLLGLQVIAECIQDLKKMLKKEEINGS
jgi:TRAP-type mannitol/chloroaromatic compound transport system permease small subunit